MEEIKYEGTVTISSAEYRDLVTKAVESEFRYDAARSKNWDLESEIKKLVYELEETKKELDSHKKQLAAFHMVNPCYPNMTTQTGRSNQSIFVSNKTEEL